MQEEWRDAPGYEEMAEVSNLGNIRTKDRFYTIQEGKKGAGAKKRLRSRTLTPAVTDYGYVEATMSFQDKGTRVRVHRLVAKAFVPGEFEGATVDHVDGNKRNNRADNLEWVTKGENTKRAWKLGLCRGLPSRLTDLQAHAIRVLYAHNFSPSIIAEWFDVSVSYAYHIGKGEMLAEKLESRSRPILGDLLAKTLAPSAAI